MADKRCENGHFIDESWDLCPYCPQEAEEPEIAIVRPRAVEPPPPPPPVVVTLLPLSVPRLLFTRRRGERTIL